MFEKVLIIGASRGLGRATSLFAENHLGILRSLTLVARKKELLAQLETTVGTALNKETKIASEVFDMSKTEEQNRLGELIYREKFDLVIYSAGGGPHGEFSQKDWKDHQWALEVGLIAPMSLVWFWLRCRDVNKKGRFVIVGSRIAEQSPDPLASSYASTKHGLHGFVSSLQQELESNQNKVWLFSPGYMDSEMLPLTAKIRHDGSKLMSVETAAQALLRWIKKGEGPWHRVLN